MVPDHINEMLHLIDEEEKSKVILYCANYFGEKAYDYIYERGIRPICFCDNNPLKTNTYLYNLPIFSYQVCKNKYKDAIYIIVGEGRTTNRKIMEQLETDGFKKEKDYFNLLDYVRNIPNTYLNHILPLQPMVIVGSAVLANMLFRVLVSKGILSKEQICYCNQYEEDCSCLEDEINCMNLKSCREKYVDALYVVLDKPIADGINDGRDRIVKQLLDSGIHNISTYFNDNYLFCKDYVSFLNTVRVKTVKYKETENCVNRIRIEDCESVLFLYDSSFSGTIFVDTVLDSHPNILNLGYSHLQSNLWYYIQQVKYLTLDEIPYRLLKLYEEQVVNAGFGRLEGGVSNPGLFIKEFKKATEERDSLTEKEILIAVYIAYFYMNGRVYKSDIPPVIYIEPHNSEKSYHLYADWLKKEFKKVVFLKMVRNVLARIGSNFRHSISNHGKLNVNHTKNMYYMGMNSIIFEKYIEDCCTLRFEDMKLYPEKVLQYLCERLEIPWSDSLLSTTMNGKEKQYQVKDSYSTTGYDLKAVYNQYDEYFSSFDRFRLELLFRERQKAYGYPYINLDFYKFDDEEVRKWFLYPFKFDKYLAFTCEEERIQFYEVFYDNNMSMLNKMEHMEEFKEEFDFGKYYTIEC